VALRLGYGLRQAATYDVILANTSVSAREILWLARTKRPIVWLLQEMQQVIEATPGKALFSEALRCCQRVASLCQPTLEMLIRDYGFPAERLELVPAFLSVPSWSEESAGEVRRAFRQRFGLGEQDLVVGGCGRASWRKGTDLFLLTAREVQRRYPDCPIRFVWIGSTEPGVLEHLEYDRSLSGLGERCVFTGELGNASAIMPALDIMAVPSREEPQGLMLIEAAAARVPLVCFDIPGGPAEFAKAGGGVAVPYLDLPEFARALVALAENPARRRALGDCGRSRALACHDVNVLAPRLWRLLESACRTGNPAGPGAR